MHARTSEEAERLIRELGPWFQDMELCGVRTAPDHFIGDYPMRVWRGLSQNLGDCFRGKSVLDVGCNAGFYALQASKGGARRVVGIDSDERYLAQARLAAELTDTPLELRHLDAYQVARLGERFDVVLFMGVLYHLRHPLLALDLLWEHVVGDLLVFQSLTRGVPATLELAEDYPFTEERLFEREGFPRLHFIERSYAHDPTNWWIPNEACAAAMLRSSGFEILEHPQPTLYICRRTQRPAHAPTVYPARGEERS